jgi:hypothetical protein
MRGWLTGTASPFRNISPTHTSVSITPETVRSLRYLLKMDLFH